jgi:hypothetical protein
MDSVTWHLNATTPAKGAVSLILYFLAPFIWLIISWPHKPKIHLSKP